MAQTLRRKCYCGCGYVFETDNPRKIFANRAHKDRSYTVKYSLPPVVEWEEIDELKHFGKLDKSSKKKLLLGKTSFSVVSFDIEATNLQGNIGRIICCSFKPIGEEPYTFHALERRFKQKDVYDDSKLAAAIRDELEKYDIIVSWNGRLFDARYINARCLAGGERTKEPQYHVDGMWAYRAKVRAWSGLDSVQQHLVPDSDVKKTTINWRSWMRVLGWDKNLREQAMDEIVLHCELDVKVLERVYRKLIEQGVINNVRKDGGIL